MILDDVNIVGIQPAQVGLDPRDQLLWGVIGGLPALVTEVLPADLGCHNELIPPAFHRLSQQFFAVPTAVDIGCIKEIDP